MNNNEPNINDLNNMNGNINTGDNNAYPIGELPSMDDVLVEDAPEQSATELPVGPEPVAVSPLASDETTIMTAAPAQTIGAEAPTVEAEPQVATPAQEPTAPAVPVQQPVAPTVPAQETAAYVAGNTFVEKEKKKWPIVLILIVLIFGGLFAYYNFVLTKPSNVVHKVMDGIITKAKNYDLNAFTNSSKLNTMNTDVNLTLTSSDEAYQSLSGMNIKAKLGYDFVDNNNNMVELIMTLQGEKAIDLEASKIGNRSYFNFKDAYPNVLYDESDTNMGMSLDMPSISEEKIIERKNNIIYLMEKVDEAISKNMSESKLSKKMILKDIDNAKALVNEITYTVDYEEYKKVSLAIYDALLADDKALTALGELFGESKTIGNELVQGLKNNISEQDLDGNLIITISVDALSNKLVELVAKDNTISITYTNKTDEAKIVYDEKDNINVDLTIDEKESKIFADIKEIKDSGVEKTSVTIKINSSDEKGNDISATLVMYDNKDVSKEVLSIVLQIKTEYNTEVKVINTENAVDINTLSEEEQQSLSSSLEGVLGMFSFGL